MQRGFQVHSGGAAGVPTYIVAIDFRVSELMRDESGHRIYYQQQHAYPEILGQRYIVTDVSDLREKYKREVEVQFYLNGSKFTLDELLANTTEYKSASQPVWMSTAVSKGKCEHLIAVYDEMVEAIFRDFSRSNGSINNVSVRGDTNC